MNCINTNLPQFKALVEESGLHPMVLSAKMGTWMTNNKTDEWPTLEQLGINSSEAIETKKDNLSKLKAARKTVADKLKEKEWYTGTELEALKNKYNYYKESRIEIDIDGRKNVDDGVLYSLVALIKESAKKEAIASEQPQRNILMQQMALGESKVASIFVGETTNSKAFLAHENSELIQWSNDAAKVSPRALKQHLRVTYELINLLSKRFNIKYKFISLKEAQKLSKDINEGTSGFYNRGNKTAYFIDGQFDGSTPFHEIFSHAFLEAVRSNPDTRYIFDDMYDEASANKEFVNSIKSLYKSFKGEDLREEIVANYIDYIIQNKLSTSSISRFFKWITNAIKEFFGIKSIVDEIKPAITIDQLTNWLLYNEGVLDISNGISKDNIFKVFSGELSKDDSSLYYNTMQSILDFQRKYNLTSDETRLYGAQVLNDEIDPKDIMLKQRIVDSNEKSTFSSFADVRKAMIFGLKSNLRSIERMKGKSPVTIERMKRLISDINSEEDSIALLKFLEHATGQVNGVNTELYSMMDKIKKGEEIDTNKLNAMKTNSIIFFSTITNKIESLSNTSELLISGLSNEKSKELIKLVNNLTIGVKNAEAKYIDIFESTYKKILRESGYRRGDVGIDAILRNSTFQSDKDLSWIITHIGSPSKSNIPQIQVLNNILQNIEKESLREFNSDPDARELIRLGKLLKQKNLGWTSYFSLYEKDENGRPTGYLVSPLKYGLFLNRLTKFDKDLNKKYNIKVKGQLPDNEADRIAYVNEREDFLAKNTERMFTPEYYKIRNSLSEGAATQLDIINDKLRRAMDKFIDPKTGELDTMLMTEADYSNYVFVKQLKKNLSLDVQMDTGEMKVGEELRIAREIRAMNEKISAGMKYGIRSEQFNKIKAKAKSELSDVGFAFWSQWNESKKIKESFYDDLSKSDKSNQSAAWISAYEQRRHILSTYRLPDHSYAYSDKTMPQAVFDKLKELDKFIAENRTKSKDKSNFNEIAQIIPTARYNAMKKAAEAKRSELYTLAGRNTNKDEAADLRAQGDKVMSDFNLSTTYLFKNSKGEQKRELLSIYTALYPKDEKYLEVTPNSMWSEVDPSSSFYNSKFSKEAAENGYQPKESIYGNKKEFDKAMSDPLMKEIYDTVVKINTKAGAIYHYLDKPSPLRISQISGNVFRRMNSTDGVFRGIWNLIKDSFSVEADDILYTDTEQQNVLADGTMRRDVKTQYRKMLRDPGSISRDLLGITGMYLSKAIEFKHKDNAKGDIELIKEGIKSTSVSKVDKKNRISAVDRQISIKDKGVSEAASEYDQSLTTARSMKVAGDTGMYKKAEELVDMYLYDTMNNSSWAWAHKTIEGFLKWTRTVNLAGNWPVIFTNVVQAELALAKHSHVKFYLSQKSLKKATWEIIANGKELAKSAINSTNHSKIISMMRYFGIASSMQSELSGLHGNSLGNAIADNFWFGPYSAGDFAVKSQMMVALMLEYRYFDDKKGNKGFYHRRDFINNFYPTNKKDGDLIFDSLTETLYDALEANKENGMITMNSSKYYEVFDKELIADIMIKADRMASSIDGMFTKQDKSKFGRSVIGKLLLLHRSWLLLRIQDAFSESYYDYEMGELLEGQYTATVNAAKDAYQLWSAKHKLSKSDISQDMVQALTAKIRHIERVNEEMPARIAQTKNTIFEISAMISLGLLTNILGLFQDDEDEEERYLPRADRRKSILDWAYLLSLRTTFEMNSLYSPMDTYALVESPTAATPLFNNMIDNLWLLGNWGEGSEIVQSGAYEGDSKHFRALVKSTPLKNMYEYYQSTDISDKEKFMIGKFLPAYSIFDGLIESDREIRLRDQKERRQEKLKLKYSE